MLITRGTLAAERDRLDDAAKVLGEALALAKTTGSAQQQVRALLQQAIVARKRGELAEAERVTNEGVELARRNDLETLAMQGLFTAANVHFIKIKNEFDQAEAGFERALEIATRYRDEGNQARAWLSLSSMNVRRAMPNKAAEYLAKARPFYEKAGNARVMGQLEALELATNKLQGRYVLVENALRRKMAAIQNAEAKLEAAVALRALLLDMGRWPEALAIVGSTGPGDHLAEAEALAALGRDREARDAWQKASAGAPKSLAFKTRLGFAEAWINLLAGRPVEARSGFEQLAVDGRAEPGVSLLSRLRICQCAAWGGALDASRICESLVADARRNGNESFVALARLYLAEWHTIRREKLQAITVLTEMHASAREWGVSEWRWRALMISKAFGMPENGVFT